MSELYMAEMRVRIVVEARAWLGTPYHHHGRVQGPQGGVDCAQLLAAVYEAVGLVPRLDLGNYSPQWHMHHREEIFLGWLARAGAHRLPDGALPQPGDVGVWRFGRTFSHGGVVVGTGPDAEVVHAVAQCSRGVTVTRLSEDPLAGRERCFWSILQ
jgi:cell wall-associated NlpC family hydrolase